MIESSMFNLEWPSMNIKIVKQSGIYTLTSEQTLRAHIEEVWDFFTSPRNLDLITPADMKFSITNQPSNKTYAGQIITYKIGIFSLFKSNCITEITHFKEYKLFVDEQRFGPYALWHHEHHYEATDDNKVIMKDIVNYKLPFGLLGDIIAANIIKRKLLKIFLSDIKLLMTSFRC